MDQEISVSTSENVEFFHEPAGIGSRFAASAIDIPLQAVMIGLIAIAFGVKPSLLRMFPKILDTWAAAALILLMFLVFWGYYIFFEMLWNGQTPGKRAVGIRTLKDGGYPIGFFNSMVRNLIRPVDFLPFFYGIGALVVFCNSRFKRIGDFAAGTIVVKERQVEIPRSLNSPVTESTNSISASSMYHEEPIIDGYRFNIYKLSEAEFNIVRQFMVRRHTIQKKARLALARKIAQSLIMRLELQPELVIGREEEFLEKVVRAYSDWLNR